MKTNSHGWTVFELTDRYRRAVYIEKEAIRQISGWFLKTPEWEAKHRLGYHLWDHAEHADWMIERLANLRGGAPEASIEPTLIRAVKRNIDAPGAVAFIRGMYLVVKQRLLDFYLEMRDGADRSANAHDIRLLNRIIPDLESQIDWASRYLDTSTNDEESHRWAHYLDGLVQEAGGISGSEPTTAVFSVENGKHFTITKEIIFDDRIGDLPLVPHAEKINLPFDDAVREQFKVFFNEIYAASILATVVHESFDQREPWEMTLWFCNHFWDEIRHSEFGAIRLGELGMSPDRCDQSLYRISQRMPFLHRICYLTHVLEKHYMPRKKPRFDEYGANGDKRSQLFADHDWSDEMNHVRNGKRWLEMLLEDDARDVSLVREETLEFVEKATGQPVAEVSPF
jgi:hypothetical protein